MIAEVIVDITNSEVDKIFEYLCEEGTQLGSRVDVPFGNKIIEGIVIGLKGKSDYPPEKIKKIIGVKESIPALTEETIDLANYVKKSCFVTFAGALRLFLPSEMRKGKIRELMIKFVSLSDKENASEIKEGLKKTAVKQKELIDFLIDNEEIPLSIVAEKFGRSAVNALIEKNIVTVTEKQNVRSPYKNIAVVNKEIMLTDRQNKAIESVENTDKTVSLIFGVTGSGKTEVYLNLIKKTLERGKTAIMLVPEIALTPQMLRQLRSEFGDKAAILHSGLSAGERFDEWWRLRTGDAKIAIGARSAIFAPLSDVGLIIIDEEHDGSYVSEQSPRFNTIDVAKYRAEYNGAKLVLGSATPSLESFQNANNGEYNLIELPDRINKKPLPEIEIADMRAEVRRGNNSPFSSALKEELAECLKKGNQAIIFLNQRGYSKSVVCTECGHVQKCKSCDVSLTYHKEDGSLLCHYCGAKYKMITECTECGSTHLKYGGAGTERVVFELKKMFPDARILRMDRDATQTKEGHFKIVSEFAERKADILVGTQMIAKGHDFPLVTLVGILDADMSLHFSDFRSGERTFQLLTQVAGRCGRAEESGKVILQTYNPENIILKQAISYDYLGFFNNELSLRSATGFPPFTEIIRVLISAENDDVAFDTTKGVYEKLKEVYLANKEQFRFFACMKSPLKKLQNKYRYQILMRINKDNGALKQRLFDLADAFRNRTVSVNFEINPNNLS